MASGHVNRVNRPNTWLHRPMLQNVKKLLPTRSRPHIETDLRRLSAIWSLTGAKQTWQGKLVW